jgi:hypothetical protein
MKLSGFLSKPRWLSKDAATRRAAVAYDDDAELLANLGRLARTDTDAGVRIAAVKRLADPRVAQALAHDDVDAEVRALARALWLDLLTGTHAAAPPLAERVRLLKAQDDNELIERAARQAREPELRRAALERIARPALLLERALADPDAGIRLGLVDRIDDEAQLERLAERARKSDKAVSRRARERIEALRIARGDGVTLEQRARQLCERLEDLLREPRQDEDADIARRWSGIEAAAPEALRARYETARQLLVASRAGPPPRPAEPVEPPPEPVAEPAAAEPPGEPAADVAAEPAPAPAVDTVAPLLAQARFAASLDEANLARRQQRERQRAVLAEIDDSVRAFDAAIETGASAQAHAAKARLDDLRRRVDAPLPPALAKALADAEGRHAELSQWQHWADNQRRRQLCEDVEALAGSGMHPDAVAARVRECQNEWTRLDAAEGRDSARPGLLARRFHAACRGALAPAQTYFRKRQELRQSHAREAGALLDRTAALPSDSDDWPAIAALRREVVEALRALDRVEPRERKALAQRLKQGLADLDLRVARRDEAVAHAKTTLIAQAEALSKDGLQRGAVAAARDLQQRWQQAGNGRRARDQAQWHAFRAAIDAVFAGLDRERTERSARDADARSQAEALCAELETLAAASAAERGAVARVQSAWDALRVRDAGLEKRFADAQTRLRDAAQRHERSRRTTRFDAWLARYRLCRLAERGDGTPQDLRERWDGVAPTDIAAAELAMRFDGAGAPVEGDAERFRELLLELELLAGIDSAAEDREQRRQLQVARLSARLRGDAPARAPDELADLLARWTVLGSAPDAAIDARLERGLAAALAILP